MKKNFTLLSLLKLISQTEFWTVCLTNTFRKDARQVTATITYYFRKNSQQNQLRYRATLEEQNGVGSGQQQ